MTQHIMTHALNATTKDDKARHHLLQAAKYELGNK